MFDQKTYCPYTGLRSFTEEEAIYFKGRDQHIEEASKQLEDRKFLMLTGSSGDGKSSLVYAGIVPYARSGFIKSQFSNWLVADFKPERKPFKNLCESLSSMLGIPNVSTVEAELSHGYSSLVELYKNSKYYNTIDGSEGEGYNDKEKTNLRRQSANLLILADQFEEFFTNPENYFKGVTSQESNLVINLLLETARIAQEENLPIYVVCTMRSDYIGQCSAFRGLPEFIGYSQFFVPRLNRKQLQEVIEEPAELSGNRISKRLVERLIYDITEGVDQLPILQHALNQIWRAADNGKEEMDLIHYAKVGGMMGIELPDSDRNKFQEWFNALPEKIQACYEHHSLQNVLNTHANKLYATAADYYHQKNKDKLSDEDVHHLIHNVFVCLTKIDHARAVRNRMTLREITEITDIDGLTTDKVKNLTAIFRDPSNTLIQPFIDEDGNDPLEEDDLLDISHESLIRNWNSLKSWADEEFNHVNTYRDYKHQVDRWIEHNRSSDYLLPIGTLTHFEDWFNKIEPNKYWINRYNQEIENKEDRLIASEEILDDCKTYLKASAQKHIVTRTVMKLGARKIAAFLGVISFLLFSSFYIYEEYSKSDEVVFDKILNEGIEILTDENVDKENKAYFIMEMVRTNPDNFELIFSKLEEKLAFELSLTMATDLLLRYQQNSHPLMDKCLFYTDSILAKLYGEDHDSIPADNFLKDYAVYVNTLGFVNYFQPSEKWGNLINKNTRTLKDYILEKLNSDNEFAPEALNLNFAFEVLLNSSAWADQELSELIKLISPLEENYIGHLSDLYKKDNTIKVGYKSSTFNHNGLYQELAYMYANIGNVEKSLSCVDTLMKYNNSYFQNNYNLLTNNATNISIYFLKNGFDQEWEEFIRQYSSRSGSNIIDFIDKLAGRSLVSPSYDSHLITSNIQYLQNNNTGLMDISMRNKVFDLYESELMKLKNPDERNFRLALLYKHRALFSAQNQVLLKGSFDMKNLIPIYDKAMDYYQQVSEEYLMDSADRMYWGARSRKSRRKAQFIFPGYLEYQLIWVRDLFSFHYMNTSFINYLVLRKSVNELYSDQEDINMISEWSSYLIGANGRKSLELFEGDINYLDIALFLDELKNNKIYSKESLSTLKVLTANKLFELKNEAKAKDIAIEIAFDNLESTLPDINNNIRNNKYRNLGKFGFFLKNIGENEKFDQLVSAFEFPTHRSSLIAYVASLSSSSGDIEGSKELIKRAKDENEKKLTGSGMAPESICLASN